MNYYYYDLILLVEEPSMKKLLDALLPRILPEEIIFLCIPHEGKHDLHKSIPRKLKAKLWNNKNTKFIILRHKDSGDCLKIKNYLVNLCQEAGRGDAIVRIVCHELESWFLGDLTAVEKGLEMKPNKLRKLQNKSKYRNPDALNSAKQQLQKIVPIYQQNTYAVKIGKHLDLSNNKSYSFNLFLQTINNLFPE